MDPTNFSKVAETATVDVIRALRATHRHTFLGRVQYCINDWKADDVKATIIANKMASKFREVDFEKEEWLRNGMGGTVTDDQQQQWDLRTQLAGHGMRSAEAWREKIQEGVEELSRVKVCWDNLWYLYELGFDENSNNVKAIWSGLLTRYSEMLRIQRDSAASASALCAVMGVSTMSRLRVVDNGERIERDGSGMATRHADFTWEWFRSD